MKLPAPSAKSKSLPIANGHAVTLGKAEKIGSLHRAHRRGLSEIEQAQLEILHSQKNLGLFGELLLRAARLG